MPKLDPDMMRQRRQHILDAATRQFEKQGFGAASVDDICAEAGISKGALYTHFKSKEAIMLEMLRQRGEEYENITANSLAELEEKIFDLFLCGLSYADSRLEMEAVTMGVSNPLLREALTANARLCERKFREIIERLVAEGAAEMIPGIDPAEAALTIQIYVLGRLSHQIHQTENLDAEARRGLALALGSVVRAPG